MPYGMEYDGRHDRDINVQHGQRDKQQQAAVAAMSKRARRDMGENHGMACAS